MERHDGRPARATAIPSRVERCVERLAAFALFALIAPVHAAVPRAEHPRPDAFRENWVTLNGEWQFEIDEKAGGEARGWMSGRDLAAKIIVPLLPELAVTNS